ncbi:TonB-dependent receptor domain-containing protein [Chromatocurvus halotolerans]|uniref:TonB-dependent receptor-like protein n=1 Tax=Chromatocurvus halotolerans TaxID=1132028 RepID=A0A4V2SBG0_9GAMM|nr:TonB-dependent receptor [Chromatocurvus halotolerans]TCO75330.1 TonB-dependent receptor-like protein [Chromatocurvus halotolerans]
MPFYDPFNFNPFNIFQLPLEQYRTFGSARYELNDKVEVYSEAFFTQSTNTTRIAPSGTFRNVLETPLSNPFLPAGIRDQICGFAGIDAGACGAAALATDPNDPAFQTVDIDYGRRFVEFGTRDNQRQTRVWQFKIGARGDLTDSISYDAFYACGESDLRGRQSGNGTRTRLRQSLMATDPNACLDPTGGCVPIDLFGPEGSLTPQVQEFLDVGNTSNTFTSLEQFQAFINGDTGLSLPTVDAPVSFVLGGEYRDYGAGFSNDLLTQTPGEVLGNGAAAPNVTGDYDVSEVFVELNVPVLQDQPFAEELTVQLGGRLSDYSTTGQESTWKIGGTWTPVSGVQFRGNAQRVTRAPNIDELFSPTVTGLDNFSTDPCAGNTPVGNAALTAVCVAQGAPAPTIGNIIVDPAGQVNVTEGGNLDLNAETADTYTIGAIIQPQALPQLSMTIDYYSIKVEDAITTPTAGDVFAGCFGPAFESGNLAIDGSSASDPACTSIRRNPATGNLFGDVSTTPGLPLVLSNQGILETDGIDLTVNYSHELGIGSLVYNLNGNWTNSSTFQASPTSVNRECVGFYSINCGSPQPEYMISQRATLSTSMAGRPVDVSLLWRYIDEMEVEPEVASAFLPQFREISPEHYFDLSVRASVTDQLQFTAAVINMMNEEPKVVGSNIGSTAFNSGNVFPSSYDPLGRRFSVTLNYRM